ncbi:MAG: hypothetical protein CO073_01140 [Candidatus Komeilibacteria bacterium CG_4_9_14_0_8_um_filter_36_9]|uniref:Uncharacterized protein n=1 Tax=Candidatus Komeilibacteria bacterium CG_4_9_14_0_8_um_filter_36_9 TaxID=1974473 RepID=A0A2M8DRX6_9BACT|nr:MAG: hypothetical protein CO073_01140 [Candidatus Komeilibacteria bacterium CG_4_9_14_0_8_um_filter_36_9]
MLSYKKVLLTISVEDIMLNKVEINYQAAAKSNLSSWKTRWRLRRIKKKNQKLLATSEVDRSRLHIEFRGSSNG